MSTAHGLTRRAFFKTGMTAAGGFLLMLNMPPPSTTCRWSPTPRWSRRAASPM
ncbi:MAG: hypothetical protein ACOC91_01785 [bacterium]